MPIYATPDEVKDIISTGDGSHNILASGPVDEVILQDESKNPPQPNKDFLFDVDKVEVGNSFHGTVTLKIEFTSSTLFDVFETDNSLKDLVLVSQSSDISNDWSHPSKDITIKSSAWGGTIEKDDVVKMTMKAYMSEKMIETRVEDTEVMIDSKLKAEGVKLTQNASDNTRLFPQGQVPSEISVACKYLTAYYIYTDVYKDKFKDSTSDDFSYVKRWKRRAEKLVKMYMDEHTNVAPKMGSFPPIINTRGTDDGLGPGYQDFQEDNTSGSSDIGWQDQFEDWF